MIHRWAGLGLAVTLTACGGGGGGGARPEGARTTAPAPGVTTPATGAPGTPGPTGAPSGTPPATTATGVPPSAPGLGGVPASPAATASAGSGSTGSSRVAAAGTYPVSVTGSESFGPEGGEQSSRDYPASSTLEISAGSTAQRRTVVVRYSPERDDTLTVDLSGGAVRLVRSVARVAVMAYEQQTTFAPTPPVVLYPAGAKVGQRFSGRFSGTQSGSYNGTVLRRERLVVGGVAVDTLVVEEKVTFSGDADGTSTTRTWWDPVRRLPVRTKTDLKVTASGATYEQHATVTLKRLAP